MCSYKLLITEIFSHHIVLVSLDMRQSSLGFLYETYGNEKQFLKTIYNNYLHF